MQANLRKREDIRLSIIALLLAHKKGCTLQQLNNDYYEVEGEFIPWKDLGYHSLPSLLNSMPNVEMQRENNVTIVKGIASEKSKHVTRLITQQKSATQTCQRKRYKPSCYYPKTAPPRIHIPAEILSSIISLVNKYPNGLDKNDVFEEIEMLMPSLHISKNDLEVQLNELSHKIVQRKGKIYPVKTETYESGNSKGFGGVSSTEFVSKEQKSPIVMVAGSEDSDDALNCSQEDDFEFSNCSYQFVPPNSNKKIQSQSSFVEETVSECQNQMLEKTLRAQMEQRASTNTLEVEFHTNTKEHNGHCLGNKNMEMLINDRIKFRLKKLIENHPDGIWCADLPEKYLEEYKVPLNYVELGFNSVREFASQLPEIFNCIQLYDTGDYKLYDVYNEVSLKKIEEEQGAINLSAHCNDNTTEEEGALPSVVSLDTCKGLIPDEVMSIGECVGYLNVAALMESKQQEPYVEVIVVEVFTPTFFWIQYRKKQRIFKTFMDDLHNFYLSNYQQYAIPPIVLERGLNCACVYNGIWHRGIIKTVKPDMQVVVMFYDYGTLKTYAAKAVYYLHKVFAYLPAQAIPCALINVRPNEGCKWSASATHNFALRTSQIPLVATVASINVEDNSMMISLTDTLGEEDVHINDWLVEQKLAKYGKMDDKVDMSNLLHFVEENLLFSPEQCYAKEDCESDKDNTKFAHNVTNAPLISPRSTLQETVCMAGEEMIVLNRVKNFIREANTEEKDTLKATKCTRVVHPKHDTNPFIQNDSVNDEIKSIISPQKLIQLWYKYYQLQMQITERLNTLMNEITRNSTESITNNIRSDQNILNTITDVLNITNQFPISSSISPDTNTYYSANTIARNDIVNTEHSMDYPNVALVNQQPLTTTSINKNCDCNNRNNYNVNISTERAETTCELDPLRKMFTGNSTFVTGADNDFKTLNQCLETQKIRESQTLPEVKACNNNVTLDQHNFGDSMHINIPVSEDNSTFPIGLKETNPFKLRLANNIHVPLTQDKNLLYIDHAYDLCKPYDSVTDHDLISFDNDTPKIKYTGCSCLNHDVYTTFGQCESIFTNSPNNANAVDVDNVTNAMLSTSISNECVQHNGHDKSNSASLWKSFVESDVKCIDETSKNVQTDTIVISKYNPFSSI